MLAVVETVNCSGVMEPQWLRGSGQHTHCCSQGAGFVLGALFRGTSDRPTWTGIQTSKLVHVTI